MESPYHILIISSVLILLSYVFNQIAGKLKIPAVLLLIGTGIGLQYLAIYYGYDFKGRQILLELLGITGLIFIVLEGALDLELTREKLPLVGKSFASALLILLTTSSIICYILLKTTTLELRQAIAYAVPLGVVSSAIAIPSVNKLSRHKREFIVYESTFSDILGIMLFNYVIQDEPVSGSAIGSFFLGLFYMLLISGAGTFFLLILLNYTKSHVKFFLIFGFIILIYSLSKEFHLPSLLFVLIFGMMLNNARIFIRGKLASFLHIEHLSAVTKEMKQITAETAFLVRTFFFILFGYMIQLELLSDWHASVSGILVLITILLTRFVFLRFISKTNVLPELFVAPRGLITIILFYNIPAAFCSAQFNEGILLFVILGSNLLMMLGLIITGNRYTADLDEHQPD